MPHSLSLTNRMADLRHSYTGETRSAIIPEIQARLATLDADDRALLKAAFEGTHTDPLPQRLRSAVIPDAASYAQQHLEASVLDAVSRAGSHHPTLLRMVRPRSHHIALHIQPEGLAPLLRELLPCEHHDGTFHGIPGLRAIVHRRHVELYLLHSIPKASLVLSAVSYRSWHDALDEIEPPQNPLRWLGNDPTPLRPVELKLEHAKPHAPVASAILRRLRLFPEPPEVTTSPEYPGVCALDWHGGPSTAHVVRALVHQLGGIATTVSLSRTDTHLALGITATRLLLRGPDLRATTTTTRRSPDMTDTQHPLTAEALCAHIGEHINRSDTHAYGTDPADPPAVGHTHTTMVFATIGGRQRWFKVNVEEIYPEPVSVLSPGHDMLVTLARRAGVSCPASGFGLPPIIRLHESRNRCPELL
ncbi:hypothetical protein [Kutzneria buriramensis]|uniref:Uncharacterized protein n=1 Tax=Kutzneria buriramensis TaxID=1045776 RepID=A0A3E0HKV8_9PSEU|nr:hypothetical protein [Kutzneria buriramensis]REH47047.1 hypothetical protein BCF44_106211 [Kutzneria buriramensis]